MKKQGLWITIFLVFCLVVVFATGCSEKAEKTESEVPDQGMDLSGRSLHIYCGAGMSKPFEEIAAGFKNDTGCEMEVVYANAAQIQTQINTAQEGDLFIAGSSEELAPVEEYISETVDLVKHIPVLVVKKGNPLEIRGLNDLTKEGVEVVLGDGEATPIGKLSNKALKEKNLFDKVNVIARTTTAPELINALSLDECDAIIVWKENASGDEVEIVNTPDLDQYIKTVPAASLTFADNSDTLDVFLDFLNSKKAKDIWEKFGYETLN